jgi:hypothetical protein
LYMMLILPELIFAVFVVIGVLGRESPRPAARLTPRYYRRYRQYTGVKHS